MLIVSRYSAQTVHIRMSQVVNHQTGEELGLYQDGELLIRGPAVMTGYFNVSSADDLDVDHWLHTGTSCYFLRRLTSAISQTYNFFINHNVDDILSKVRPSNQFVCCLQATWYTMTTMAEFTSSTDTSNSSSTTGFRLDTNQFILMRTIYKC